MLRRKGVEIVHPERLTFADQVRLVNRHRVFIGNVGSAFHSLMYVLPERRVRTVVIENTLNDHIANYVMIDLLKNVEANYLYVEALDRAPRQRTRVRRPGLEPRPYGRLDVDAVESSLRALSVI
jgi:capsular polysaccharide biosynthesis protein